MALFTSELSFYKQRVILRLMEKKKKRFPSYSETSPINLYVSISQTLIKCVFNNNMRIEFKSTTAVYCSHSDNSLLLFTFIISLSFVFFI